MHGDIYNLWMLLQIHKELIGHPKLKNIRNRVDAELARMDAGPAATEPGPVPVYPANSGLVEVETEADLPSSDRRV